MLNFLDTANMTLMRKSLDALWERETVILNNIANVDTPKYKAKRLLFENIMSDKINEINLHSSKNSNIDKNFDSAYDKNKVISEINSVQTQIVTDNRTETRADGNNVDIDHENVELVRAKFQYDYMIRKITDEYNLLRKAITEGRS